MKNLIYNILQNKQLLDVKRFIPKVVISLTILSLLFLYILHNQVGNQTTLIPWFIALNIINLVLITISNRHLNILYNDTLKNQDRYYEAQRKLDRKEKKLSSLLSQAPVGIFYFDSDLKIMNYNRLFYEIFGLETNLKGFNLKNLEDKKAIKVMSSVLKDKSSRQYMGSYNFSFQEKTIWAELTCSALLDERGRVTGGIGILEDKTIEHKAFEKINQISLIDSLTGLPNRRSYKNFMLELIESPQNQSNYSILFYMDLNNFKQINDTFGHFVGDNLLIEVSRRFKLLALKNSHLSRLGGDEFLLAMPFVSNNQIFTQKKAKKVAKNIQNLFLNVFEIEGLDLYMTTSVGIVIIEPKSDDIDTIIRQADMAMYQTKRDGQNNISFYNHTLDLEQQELTTLQQDLNHAIGNSELELYYQPIVDIKDDKLTAVEALIRWNHSKKGLIMPDRFIPMATESGLINRVGWWVADEVCRQISIWKESDIIDFEYIAININARQLHEVDFSKHLENCIIKHKVDPAMIKLEVTETTLIDSFTKTQKIIKDLKSRGVECNIDDFGTGYSSLSYLKKLSFKVLKIDRFFISEILEDKDSLKLVKSIIDIGKQFNYKVIIEGIETIEQKNKILELNDSVSYQGFLCSRPIPALLFEKRFLID